VLRGEAAVTGAGDMRNAGSGDLQPRDRLLVQVFGDPREGALAGQQVSVVAVENGAPGVGVPVAGGATEQAEPDHVARHQRARYCGHSVSGSSLPAPGHAGPAGGAVASILPLLPLCNTAQRHPYGGRYAGALLRIVRDQVPGQVPFSGSRQHHHHQFARALRPRRRRGRSHRPRHLDLDDLVDDLRFEDPGHEPGGKPARRNSLRPYPQGDPVPADKSSDNRRTVPRPGASPQPSSTGGRRLLIPEGEMK
jgi:hypothetical protein